MIAIEEEYRKLRPTYESYCERLQTLISQLLAGAGVRVHAIENRAKDVESFKQKLQKPEKKYTNPLREITDLCGIRIIVFYLNDLERVRSILDQEFEIDEDNSSDRGAVLKPNEFGYHSHHYVINLSTARKNLSEWRAFSDICAEIQVRTVLQHAWAAISHALQYKAKTNVPAEVSRKLFRVSGLLELADEEFSEIHTASKSLTESIVKSIEEGNFEIGINISSIKQYLASSITIKEITDTALKAGFKFHENSEYDDDEKDPTTDITWACKEARLTTISELDTTVKDNLSLLYKYFSMLISRSDTEWRGGNAWFLTLTVLLLRIDYFDEQTIVKSGWNDEIASLVLSTARDVLKDVQQNAAPARKSR